MNADFRTTRWSVVLEAGGTDSGQARAALETLCTQYWVPLYAFARRRGASEQEAEDLVQGFFARLIEKRTFEQADPERGRFRGFLSTAFQRHLANVHAHDVAQKRGGGARPISLNRDDGESQYRLEPADPSDSPERVFERRWAMALLNSVMHRLRGEWRELDRERDFDMLSVFLGGHSPVPTHAEVATELALSSGAVKVAVHRLRKRYGALVREAVAATVSDPKDVDAELRELAAALRR